ncbi:tail length tape measure protein [Gordonia phage Fryberger]|uniref:Tape measure protein n=1 Tax=Gordonia phage Fryberger TaxID=2250392 RepID=A0A346FCK5_9CAUD|nr:tail length tape measure protein [Gordonia phage Fryberger]AXN53469.1 tape measure protein [Gordonia phage Fryberger]
MAIELAQAYVSLHIESKDVPKEVGQALGGNQTQREATKAGEKSGGKFASGMGKVLLGAGAAVGAAGGAAIGGALASGFSRLSKIEEAKSKLTGLGNTSMATSEAMDSALQSVQGTAYGLDDAATIAASAMAAGVKPGKELTNYLKLTADTASITGASLSDTGRVMNNVTTLNNAYNDSLQVLAQRGLPIYTWLSEELGVSTAAVKDLAKEGKISAAVFQRAIAKHVSGAALDAGDTVQGSFENMVTAVTRLGAAFLEPSFKRGPGLIAGITTRIDALAPTVRNLGMDVDDTIFNKLIPGLEKGYAAAKPWAEMQWKSGIGLALQEAGDAIQDLTPAVKDLFKATGLGGGAAGVSMFGFITAGVQAFTAGLEAVTPLIKSVSGFLAEHTGIVKAAVGAYLTFKFAQMALGGLRAGWAQTAAASGGALARMRAGMSTANIQGGVLTRTVSGIFTTAGAAAATTARPISAINTLLRGTGTSAAVSGRELSRISTNLQNWGSSTTPIIAGTNRQISTFGSNTRTAATNTGTLGQRFANAGRNALTAGGQMARAIGSTLGLTAAIVGVGMLAQSWSDARANSQRYAASLRDVEKAQSTAFNALIASRGETTPDVVAATAEQVKGVEDALNSVKGPAWHQRLGDFFSPSGEDSFSISNIPGLGPDMPEKLSVPSRMQENHDDSQRALKVMDALKITTEEMGVAVSGTSLQWQTMRDRLTAAGDGGNYLLSKMVPLRIEHEASAKAARELAPGTMELGRAIDIMGDSSASASSKLKALKEAMDAANPQGDRASGMAAYGEAIRQVQNEIGNLSGVVIRADGSLDTVNESGAKLYATLRSLAEGAGQAAVSGNMEDMKRVAQENEQVFRQLADATGLSIGKIKELYGTFGGKTVDITMSLANQPEIISQLGFIKSQLDGVKTNVPITIGADQVTKDTEAYLTGLGIKVDRLADPSGKTVKINAQSEGAEAALAGVMQKIIEFNNSNPEANMDLNTARFNLKAGEATDALTRLKNSDATPKPVDLIIDKLLQGKQISVQELAVLSATTANPKVALEAKEVMAKIQAINDALDQAARERRARIVMEELRTGQMTSEQFGQNFDRNIRARANENGSITMDHFANGGFKHINKPTKADIYQGRGAGTVFAESKTKGEAYIPLAPEKRGRSSQILGTVAKAFGFQLLKNGQSKVNLNKGNPNPKDFKGTVVNGMRVYADGGISIDDFDALARGEIHGNIPLQGAPYVWGGVHWGDCSGAMSAFSNLAAGLPPWGSRWATGSAEGELKRRGFTMGRGTDGDLRFGWHNNGVGHTAGTLPSGANVEMGGANNGGAYNGSVGADDGQFTNHAYMSGFGGGYDYSSPDGEDKGGYVIRPDGSFYYDPNLNTSGGSNSTIVGPFDGGGNTDSISGLFGSAASAAVAGQVSDILGVFGIPDQPSQLAAYNEYIDARKGYLSGMLEKLNKEEREKNGGTDGTGSKLKDGSASPLERQELKDKKDQLKRSYDDAKFERSMKYDEAKDMLADKYRPKGSDKNAYRRELDELEDRYKREEFDKKREYDDAVDALERGLTNKYLRNDQPGTSAPESETGAQQSGPQEQVINYNPAAGAGQWAPYVARVLTMLGLDQALGDKVIAQIDIESKGDPRAVNEGYSAGGGHPSGLLQTLPDTFNAFKSGQLSSDIFDPMANIYAGCNYANNDPKYKDRGIAGIWPTTAGYAKGGPVSGKGTGTSDEIPLWASNGEFIVDAATTKAAGALLPHLNGNPKLAAAVSDFVMGTGNLAKQYSPQIGIAAGVADAVNSTAVGAARQIQSTATGFANQFRHNAPANSTVDNRVMIESISAKDADDIARKIARNQRVRAMTYSGRP